MGCGTRTYVRRRSPRVSLRRVVLKKWSEEFSGVNSLGMSGPLRVVIELGPERTVTNPSLSHLTPLADQPLNVSDAFHPTTMLALSVEFPTVITRAHRGAASIRRGY